MGNMDRIGILQELTRRSSNIWTVILLDVGSCYLLDPRASDSWTSAAGLAHY
jgi:hypothetical protein